MNKAVKKKGFTLIELIISIALFAILSVAFLSMFSTGIKGIFNAGNKSKANYTSQQALENELSGKPVTVDSVNVSSSDSNMELDFDGIKVDVNGKIRTLNYDNGRQRIELVTFTPNP